MATCIECRREMRPRKATAEQYPGTVAYNGVKCTNCTFRPAPDERHANKMFPCKRCGIEREARKNAILCADCRSVLTPGERAIWAA